VGKKVVGPSCPNSMPGRQGSRPTRLRRKDGPLALSRRGRRPRGSWSRPDACSALSRVAMTSDAAMVVHSFHIARGSGYGTWLSLTARSTAVDIGVAAEAFRALAGDPSLRGVWVQRKMKKKQQNRIKNKIETFKTMKNTTTNNK